MPALRTWIADRGLAVLWALQPLVAGPAFAAALSDRSSAVQATASIGLWALWAVTLLALLIPRTTTLTLVRVVIPASVAATLWAAIVTPDPGWRDALALASTALSTALALAPSTGERFVNGSAYGPERRFPLRAPGLVALGLVEVVWAVVVAGAVAGPLLLAAEQWVPGALALLVGWPLAAAASRSLHRLAQRWLVFVPAGITLVDPLALTDAVAVPRARVAAIRLAPADTDAHDLTVGALGLAIEVDLDEPLTITPLTRSSPPATIDVDRLLFTPTRPGALLRAAAARGLPLDAPA